MGEQGYRFTEDSARRIASVVKDVEGTPRPVLPPGTPRRGRIFPQPIFAVRVTIDGGSAGSLVSTCSYTYRVETDAGLLLGEGLSPQKCRLPNVPYTATPAASWGAAFLDKNSELVLWDANECPDVEDPCPS